jgi:hypothetical protein
MDVPNSMSTVFCVLRNSARALPTQAVQAEIAALLSYHADKLTDDGRQRPVGYGHLLGARDQDRQRAGGPWLLEPGEKYVFEEEP